jgi:hypothetical protein
MSRNEKIVLAISVCLGVLPMTFVMSMMIISLKTGVPL